MTGDHAVTAQRADAASTARKRFAAGKNMKWAGSACPFESNVVPRKTKILWGAVSGEKGKHQL